MPSPEKVLLLDTHVWLWVVGGVEPLKRSVLSTVEEAARGGRIRVSAISVWEVAMLEAKGRIRLTKDCLAWVQEALAAPGTSLVPLSPEIAVESSRLPGTFHGDPADRILVATARLLGGTLLTRDDRILAYGKGKHVSVKAV
ncbi:MAG TPA: type II toxin-antitoxin system VapC family toxin [Candidatus Deferrimicrobiaceae bacterium]|jgi:PIN domain nuclease of toxin-antitoxin system|nr:type II toxin-antitoxin system VapC family toxin [Candidatus Deferrimicrobiaceae bacterium]